MNKTLYLIRGLPGAGKTTFATDLAESLNLAMFEADDYFYDRGGNYNFNPTLLHKAHNECQEKTEKCMVSGNGVVVSNTFTTEKELKPYLDLAEKYGYRVVALIVENRHGSKSVHDVPETTIQKMKDRFSVKL